MLKICPNCKWCGDYDGEDQDWADCYFWGDNENLIMEIPGHKAFNPKCVCEYFQERKNVNMDDNSAKVPEEDN